MKSKTAFPGAERRSNTVRLVRLSTAEFAEFGTKSIREYARIQVKAGLWAKRGALARAADAFHSLLRNGIQTPHHHFWSIRDRGNGDSVGVLWFAVVDNGDQREGFIYDIAIDPRHRRRGYAASTLRALAARSKSMGLSAIRLRVHAHNKAARALYQSLAFQETDIMMALPLAKPRTADGKSSRR